MVGVSIYQKQKNTDAQNYDYDYLSGFGNNLKETPLDAKLIKSLNNSYDEGVTYSSYEMRTNGKVIDTYRFVRPIIFKYHNSPILLGIVILYYDKKAINDVIATINDHMLSIEVSILLLAILFIYFIGVRFTAPVLKITKAATAITNGDLNVNLDIRTNDELEHLAYHFNLMIKSLREKNKMRKFVSDSTMDMIQSDSNKESVLGGEYRTLTFLFCDIRDFTSSCENKKPSEIISVVNFYFNIQSQIIIKNGGYIDKFIGDEIMAFFSGVDATKRAIKSGIEIQNEIKRKNEIRDSTGKTTFNVGIGINRGEVIVGNMGYSEHMDFTSVGLAVNIAARLCSSAKAGQVIIDKKTFDEANSDYPFVAQAPFLIKGVSHPIDTYEVFEKSA